MDSAASSEAGWAARLTLGVEARGGRSVLARRAHVGPLRVQRALYPEGAGVCHAVIVHPPGGVVGGDTLTIDVDVAAGAHALVTTPAAMKLYRSAGPWARMETRLRVGDGGGLEHVPQETIAIEGCRVVSRVVVELAATARFVGWEVTVLGRPAVGTGFERGTFEQRIAVERAGRPVFLECAAHVGGDERLSGRWGLGGHAVVGTMIAVGAAGDLDAVRAAIGARATAGTTGCSGATPTALTAATRIEHDVVLVRYLGDDARAALAAFEAARAILRPALFGRPAVAPRIWAT